ncbi:hypothetical protein [Paraburkholderia strydomiana]|uniref:hypothetical protein n=1 Tax=Paraburkholderia strydomiana TaxID=1245417 RepID=UPI0028622C41|nr:hypothetical protein [Paraburkholderia strydomiana]MDR7008983.1 hypothetical protein [Paraburkholderia strydomiana]
MRKSRRPVVFVVLTPVFYLFSLWISVFPHEYAHSITAWLLGYKLNAFDIDYGSFDWKNVLFVDGIDEHVNYFLIYLLGNRFAIGMIAFAGPFIATSLLYLVSWRLIRWKETEHRPLLFYFLLWVNITNLSELISYVVLRSITKHGDVGHIEFAWGVSPWLVFTVGCVLLSIAFWDFFYRTIIDLYRVSGANRLSVKCFFVTLFSVYLLAYPATRVLLENNDQFSTDLSILLSVLTPAIVIVCWPARTWVRERERARRSCRAARLRES